ncbi:hypothetical protein [Chloroflexus sp.]|nr:hypothetical protein [Chloroflexus sp.]
MSSSERWLDFARQDLRMAELGTSEQLTRLVSMPSSVLKKLSRAYNC